jgi:hypothetical protein
MRRRILCVAALAALLAASAHSDTFHDRPDPEATGGIRGKTSGAKLQEALAIEQLAKKCYQGHVNADSYTFNNLPPGKYDLILKFEEDVIEGMRLDIWGETEEISIKERMAIKKLIDVTDDFYHDKHIIRAGGTAKKQKLIVEQIRTETIFHPDGSVAAGQMLRRIDYIVLKKTREIWQIELCRNVYRKMRPKAGPGSVLRWHYNSTLGGIRVADDAAAVEEVTLEKKRRK